MLQGLELILQLDEEAQPGRYRCRGEQCGLLSWFQYDTSQFARKTGSSFFSFFPPAWWTFARGCLVNQISKDAFIEFSQQFVLFLGQKPGSNCWKLPLKAPRRRKNIQWGCKLSKYYVFFSQILLIMNPRCFIHIKNKELELQQWLRCFHITLSSLQPHKVLLDDY